MDSSPTGGFAGGRSWWVRSTRRRTDAWSAERERGPEGQRGEDVPGRVGLERTVGQAPRATRPAEHLERNRDEECRNRDDAHHGMGARTAHDPGADITSTATTMMIAASCSTRASVPPGPWYARLPAPTAMSAAPAGRLRCHTYAPAAMYARLESAFTGSAMSPSWKRSQSPIAPRSGPRLVRPVDARAVVFGQHRVDAIEQCLVCRVHGRRAGSRNRCRGSVHGVLLGSSRPLTADPRFRLRWCDERSRDRGDRPERHPDRAPPRRPRTRGHDPASGYARTAGDADPGAAHSRRSLRRRRAARRPWRIDVGRHRRDVRPPPNGGSCHRRTLWPLRLGRRRARVSRLDQRLVARARRSPGSAA